jgi:hypothetical protein
MKKYLQIIILLILISNLKAQEDNSNIISEFSAKMKKGSIYLKWENRNLSQLYKIRLEVKYPDENVFQLIDEIGIESYSKKILKDSSEYLQFFYTYKPVRNGVYYFKINLIDKNLAIKSTDVIKIGVSDIVEFKLFQNSPNPFNPKTSISYELYSATKVTLKVYALDGREIETLVEEYQNPGTYRIEFNAVKLSDLSSGIYFYKLQTDRSSDIKKMIFEK